MNYLYIIVAGIAGLLFGKWVASKHCRRQSFGEAGKKILESRTETEKEMAMEKAKEVVTERTENRKEKILNMMRESREDFSMGCNLREGENKKGITREEVEKLLGVSGGTALKYLNELEKEKKIEQVGFSGKDVYYILIG